MKGKIFSLIIFIVLLNIFFIFGKTDSSTNLKPTLKWKTPLEEFSTNQISGSIALDKRNNIYISFLGSPGSSSAMLSVFNSNGIKKWDFPLRNFSASNPVIGEDGQIYIISNPSLYAISPKGELLWENEEFHNLCNLSLGTNQKLYSYDCSKGINGRKIWSIQQNGSIDWSSPYENNSKITIDQNNNILFFYIDRLRKENFLIKLDGTDGNLLWRFRVKDEITKSTGIVISIDGSILINLKPTLISINKNGTEKWRIIDFYSRNPPIIDREGTIYAFNEIDGFFDAINLDGTVKWKKEIGTVLPSFITENGLIQYFFANNSNQTFLQSINQDGIDQWTIPLDPTSSAPIISNDGTIFGFYDEHLVAYQGNSKLSSLGWSRANHDNKNTSCAGKEQDESTSIPKKVAIEMIVENSQALVNGFPFTIEPPFLYLNRTYIPFRFLGEFLDADVDFTINKASKLVDSVSYTTTKKCISLFINQTKGMINGNIVQLDSPPLIRNSRTFLPLRFISEALGATVNWDSKTKTIKILYEQK